MDVINFPGAIAKHGLLLGSQIVQADDLLVIGKKVSSSRDGSQYEEMAITVLELMTLAAGGNESLAQTLVIGNTTSGRDISITAGDSIVFNRGVGGILDSLVTTGLTRRWYLPDDTGTIALLSTVWAHGGNTVGSVQNIGTIDAYDFPIITTNIQRARFYADGRFLIGTGAVTSSIDDVTIGGNSLTAGGAAVAIGYSAIANGSGTVAIGYGSQALINRGVAVGFGAIASSQGVSVGFQASTNDRGFAGGYSAVATGSGVAIGESASAVGGVSLRGSGTGAASFAVIGSHSGGGSGIAILGVAESDDNIAIGFRSKATAVNAMIFGRSIDNATYLTNNIANSVGFGWSEATPTVLFAKTADQFISGTGGLCIGAQVVSASAQLEVTSTTKGFRVTPITATQASAITAVEGLMVCVSDTNGTFTSIGYWAYENGTWVKH